MNLGTGFFLIHTAPVFFSSYTMTLETGVFSITSEPITFTTNSSMTLGTGVFTITGGNMAIYGACSSGTVIDTLAAAAPYPPPDFFVPVTGSAPSVVLSPDEVFGTSTTDPNTGIYLTYYNPALQVWDDTAYETQYPGQEIPLDLKEDVASQTYLYNIYLVALGLWDSEYDRQRLFQWPYYWAQNVVVAPGSTPGGTEDCCCDSGGGSTPVTLTDTEIAYGSPTNTVTSDADFTKSSGTVNVIRSTIGASLYVNNAAASLNGDSAIVVENPLYSKIGLGYNNASPLYPCMYAPQEGIYLRGHGNYGVYIETPLGNIYPNAGVVVPGKVRIGDSNFNTGRTLEVIGNSFITNVSSFGGNHTSTAFVDAAGSTSSNVPIRLRPGVANGTIASPQEGMINNDGTFIWLYLGGIWNKIGYAIDRSTSAIPPATQTVIGGTGISYDDEFDIGGTSYTIGQLLAMVITHLAQP